METMFSRNKNITYLQIFINILVWIIAKPIIFKDDNPIFKFLSKNCVLKCPKDCENCAEGLRGSRYYMATKTTRYIDPQKCAFTSWELIHFLLHIYIGYFFDIYYSIIIGVSFEIYELINFDCASFPDLFWNLMGGLLGQFLRTK